MWCRVDIVLVDVSEESITPSSGRKKEKLCKGGTGASKGSQTNVELNCIKAGSEGLEWGYMGNQ
jgi:hypothetical protein